MTRRFPLLAVLFVLALALAACPEDVEEAIEDDQPTEPIEQVRDAASNTLGADSAAITILLQADAEPAPTDDGTAPTDDDVTAPEDDAATTEDDETTTTEEDDGLTDDDTTTDDGTDDGLDPADPAEDVAADRDEVELTGQEDFTADRRQLTATNGEAGQLELIVDGTDIYILLNGDDTTADAPTDEPTPTPTAEDDDNGLEDDDDATDGDDAAGTDEEPDTTDEQWGWFDLTELHTDATEDDTTDEATTTATTDDDLDRFPFRDSHLVLQVLEDVEGDVNEAQDETGEGFDVYDVTVDVQETQTTADGDEWLERLAKGEEQVTITVWIDDGYVVQVEYDHGSDTDTTAPEDDAVTDDDDTTVTDDDDTVTDDEDLTAMADEAAFTVAIEYRDLGEGVETELPDDEQVIEIDEQELRQLLPALPGETDDTTDSAPTG